jgi:hypothetical protein
MNREICDDELLAFKKRYSNIHPLIFHRSLERARNSSDLFEILESIPRKFPIVWDDSKRSWVKESDLLSQNRLDELGSKKRRK